MLLGDLNFPGRLPARVTRWRPLARVKTFPGASPSMQIDHALGHGLLPVVAAATARELPLSDHRALILGPSGAIEAPSNVAPMALQPLSNAGWGFETNCFVCEPSNPLGLRVPYFLDEEAGVVTAEFTLGVEHSGAPHYVHGGVLLAILDEAMAWAAIAIGGRFAVVQSTATTFDRPVRIDEPHHVEASIHERTDTAVTARATVSDAGGRRCARARARLVVLSTAVAGAAIGPVTGADIRYLRPLPSQENPQ